jgi:ribosome maturation factor RimP
MKIEELKVTLTGLITPVVNAAGVELYDMEVAKMKGKILLRVYIDREGGVMIDDCELVSREIEAMLDVEDPIPYSYVLEVSSPGLDRPLKKPEDFKRFSGKKVRLVTRETVEKQNFFVGEIELATDDIVVLLLPRDRKITIPYDNISRARLEVEV